MSSAKELITKLQGLDPSSFSSEEERREVEQALRSAFRKVQKPFDILLDQVWAEPITAAFVKQLIDTKLFEKWVAKGGAPQTVSELAELSGVEQSLLKRILRVLAAQALIDDVSPDGSKFAITDFGKALGDPAFNATYTYYFGMQQQYLAHWPKYMEKLGHKLSPDPRSNCFKDCWNEDMFVFLGQNPAVADAFNKTMVTVTSWRAPWINLYPTEKIVADLKPGVPLVVDVGGGIGHDLEKFRAKHPETASQLVLQDLPPVVESAQPTPPVQKQGIDIFAGANPAKGARVYFIKTVLHDWPEDKAVDILQNIAKSMERGYSKVLLYEIVVSNSNRLSRVAVADATMLMMASAGEREESDWRRIAEKAGFKIVEIHSPGGTESIIELDLV